MPQQDAELATQSHNLTRDRAPSGRQPQIEHSGVTMTTRRDFLTCLSFTTAFLAGCGGGDSAPTDGEGDSALTDGSSTVSSTRRPPPLRPPKPPASPDPRIRIEKLDLANLVFLKSFHESSRYERFRRLHILEGESAQVGFHGFDFTTGGTQKTLGSARYSLLLDGTEAGSATVAAGATAAEFEVDLRGVAAGWRRVQIGGLAPGETSPTWFVFVKKGSVTPQAFTPVVQGTYTLAQRGDGNHIWAEAPGAYSPTARPLLPRAAVPFSNAITRGDMHCTQLVPLRHGDIHRVNRNKDGILSSFDLQSYFWSGLTAAMPTTACLDGPRGIGTVSMATHLEVGKGPSGNIFFCDPWRVGKISPDGTITTLAGYRSTSPIHHWEDPADVELVGDWAAIPVERRGFHELWGMAWDERTLGVNTSAAPIPSEGNQQPHVVGPVAFVTDTQNNRVCKLEFSPTSRSAPPKVSEFIVGLHDPWDIVYRDGVIYVSERLSHRIAAYDATTGQYIRTVVSGAPLATLNQIRQVVRQSTLTEIRAENCVAPEGLYRLDDWLYFGSMAQAQIRRVNLVSGVLEVVNTVPTDGNSNFVKFAISDGSFGPKGSVFTCTWSAAEFGLCGSALPNGEEWWWGGASGGTGRWSTLGYPAAVGVGQGRLVLGGVVEGVLMITQRQAGDQEFSAAAAAGENEYKTRGLDLLHGENGFGFYALPLPWGVSTNIDAFLLANGHTRG